MQVRVLLAALVWSVPKRTSDIYEAYRSSFRFTWSCGRSSMVERHASNVLVAGSNPAGRIGGTIR